MFLRISENHGYIKTEEPVQRYFEEHFFDPLGNDYV